MASNPTVAARPFAGGLLSTGSMNKLPVKSILRDGVRTAQKAVAIASQDSGVDVGNGHPRKRKLGDRVDSNQDTRDPKRRNLSGGMKFSQSGSLAQEAGRMLDKSGESDDEDIDVDGGDDHHVVLPSVATAKAPKTVHFDMSLNMTTEVGRRTLDDVKRLVRRAIETHAAGGDSQEYLELVDVFSEDPAPRTAAGLTTGGGGDPDEDDERVRPEELVLYVVALTSCTPLLNKACVTLVKQLLACSWLGRDEAFVRAYVQFLAALVSAQGVYMRSVLEMFVDKFKEPRSSAWTVADYPTIDRDGAQKRLHSGLRYILKLFPAARQTVCKLISQKFPFPAESKSVHMFYLDNLLCLREYAPNLGPDVLETITSHIVKLDTEFQLDLSDMDDEAVAQVVLQVTSKDDDRAMAANGILGGERGDDDGDDDDNDDDDDDTEADESDMPAFGDPDYDEEAARIDRSTKLVEILDAMLDRLFSVFSPVFDDPDSDAARGCLEDMLSDFANFVLTVPSSRHTQFLVFHFSQKSLALQDVFTGTLLNLGFESNRPSAVRQAAAAYLSSYVARAARVPRDTVRNVARILCHRIEAFRRRHGEGCRGPDLRRYQELYAWVQALLYIFCFRWRDLVDAHPDLVDPDEPATFVGQDLDWMPGLKLALTNIIYAAFNPLMVCSPPIVAEFAKLAHALRLMYVFPRIESNKSLHLAQFASGRYGHGEALREDAGTTVADDKWLQLEGNFPFDPYHLPVSKRWLVGDYVAWTPIPGVSGGEEEEEEDDEDDDDDDEDDEEDPATDPEDM
ncbi:RNA polymerase 1 specific transcription initiation factor rrn3 superfamily [Niveomyces insectorum RCEF 264]|uniref:RNA polymerase 1 specific transcription initiation factor rrn3 superfamily n=1 Tax=Niveomyces insectorum RCEF 264 TaxID=1081102 RepID=A0A167VGX6_9HYPO|nr:RNA polymerase 1 specific transcription initiation factor rrn3 superfamily [Niveomyces insectorum RCEF 264]